MTCDRLAKCFGSSENEERTESRRDREVHKRLIHQAPKFFIPTTRTDLRFWKKTVDIVKENLDQYDYYPFGVVSPFGIYRLRYTDISFWYGIAIGVVFLLLFIFILNWTMDLNKDFDERNDYELDMYATGQIIIAACMGIVIVLFTWMMFKKNGYHTLYLDCQSLFYEVYRFGSLHYRGHFHNIYVKLKCLQTSKDKKTRDKQEPGIYYLTLNGCHFSPIYLSPYSKNCPELRRLGKKIATNFNINFVDSEPVSKHHQIRHRCPYGATAADEDGLDSFFDVADEWTDMMSTTSNVCQRRATTRRTTGRVRAKTESSPFSLRGKSQNFSVRSKSQNFGNKRKTVAPMEFS